MLKIRLWNKEFSVDHLSDESVAYLNTLPKDLPDVEWVWQEMDSVWDCFQLDNSKPFKNQKIADFYRHPVWLMNGFFTHLDVVSRGHRNVIANYLINNHSKQIADFGGGFGELAIEISKISKESNIDIVEPYPTKYGVDRIKNYKNINFTKKLEGQTYDAIVAQDVLEHVEDPILTAYEIASSLDNGGKAIFANCFYPVIKCHIPSNFHLRYTFPKVMRSMGLKYLTNIKGAEHAQVFELCDRGKLNLKAARKTESMSKFFHPMINNIRETLSKIKNSLKT